MNQSLALWILGLAASGVGTVALLMLNRSLRHSDEQASTISEMHVTLARVDVALRGVNGDNGLVGDVRYLRSKQHETTNAVHALTGRVALNEERVAELRERLA